MLEELRLHADSLIGPLTDREALVLLVVSLLGLLATLYGVFRWLTAKPGRPRSRVRHRQF